MNFSTINSDIFVCMAAPHVRDRREQRVCGQFQLCSSAQTNPSVPAVARAPSGVTPTLWGARGHPYPTPLGCSRSPVPHPYGGREVTRTPPLWVARGHEVITGSPAINASNAINLTGTCEKP